MDNGMYKFYKPIKIDDEEVKELKYDFSSLPSGSLRKATSELMKINHMVIAPQNDTMLHAILFGYAAGLDSTEVMTMHDKDIMGMATVSMTFFNSDSEG